MKELLSASRGDLGPSKSLPEAVVFHEARCLITASLGIGDFKP